MVDDDFIDEDGLDENGTLVVTDAEDISAIPDGESFAAVSDYDADAPAGADDDGTADDTEVDGTGEADDVADADGNPIVVEDYEDDNGDEQLASVAGDEEDDLSTEFAYTDDDGVPLDEDGNELAVDDVDDYTARAADDPMNFDAVADEDVEDMDA